MKRNPELSALRAIVGLLLVIGVSAIVSRGYEVAYFLRQPPHPTAELSPRERAALDLTAKSLGIDRASATFQRAKADVLAFSRRYNTHPVITYLHLVPALIFLLLAPLQFSRRIRTRYRTFHRWSGRILLINVVAISASAFYFGLLMPFGGTTEAVAIATFGALFLFSAGRAFRAIRAGDVARHREWMIRMVAVALGVSAVRIVGPLVILALNGDIQRSFAPGLWLGWLLTLGAAELWIRRTRVRADPPVRVERARPTVPA